jgi:cyclic pyranopterin phosphate synthase
MFTHLDQKDQPQMVDVGKKTPTRREAQAQALISFPEQLAKQFSGQDIQTKKGSVFQTAILAGIMGAKKTSELIPLCHPLGLDDCKVDIQWNDQQQVVITSKVAITHKTGVEMEALTAVSVAALTIYDMCKSMGHGMIIHETKLLSKSGGKSDYVAP